MTSSEQFLYHCVVAVATFVHSWTWARSPYLARSVFRLRKYVAGEWLLVLTGIASIALGVVIVAVPLTGASVDAFWLGVYAFVFGALLVALAFRLRAD